MQGSVNVFFSGYPPVSSEMVSTILTLTNQSGSTWNVHHLHSLGGVLS
jgi:hypothetical protein